MSKIICDICGTGYQDTADCCPICGCVRGAGAALLGEELAVEETVELTPAKNDQDASRKKQIFDYDEVNPMPVSDMADPDEDEPEYDDDDDDTEEEEPHHNTLVVILLTVLIAALLLAGGFIFVRYFLPNMGAQEQTVPETTLAQVEETAAPTEARIACETLILNSSLKAELTEVGFSHLINVMPSPKDTTDALVFVSADQSVATVSEDGKITAVGEGETIVTVTCGDVQMFVNVTCNFTPETTAAEETVAAEETEAAEETSAEATEETAGEAAAETEAVEATNKEIDSSITLKLKKTDIRLGVYYQFRLELDCDLDAKDVEWSSEHPYIATVNEEGVITAVKAGTTAIIVKYGDQEVQCIVRCF